MKKRYLLLAGVLVLGLAASGCGKKEETVPEELPVTVAPVEEKKEEKQLVEMQKSSEEQINNVMGEKTATSSKLILINKTGSEVAAIYIRPNTDDDDEWGEDLVQGMFTLKNGDKALYYYEKGSSSLYDIRISYTDEEKSECFFRKLPLNNITQITLCMDGTGEDAIPYATYLSGTAKTEVSTLKEVKQRLGLLDDEDESKRDNDTAPTPTPEETQYSTPTATPVPQDPQDQDDPSGGGTGEEDEMISAAKGCIGQSLDSLIGTCGEPDGSDYENEPESGETGYHYYTTDNGSFTVSTTVDENGNEIVAGVW